MNIIKFTLSIFALSFLSSCVLSFPDNRTSVAYAGVDPLASCKLNRLQDYAVPGLPDIAGLEFTNEEDVALVSALVDHIAILRGDLRDLTSGNCINY